MATSSIDWADAPSADGLVVKVAIKVFGQFLRRLIAPLRLLFQALQADRFQVAGDFGIELPQRNRIFLQNLHQRVEGTRGLKRRSPGEQAIQHGS